jgi:hypothetical protein
VSDRLLEVLDIVALLEATEATPAKRGMPTKALFSIAWAVLTGVLYWLLTHFLYSWFVQYLDVAYKIQDAKLIASISSYVIPALLSSADNLGCLAAWQAQAKSFGNF